MEMLASAVELRTREEEKKLHSVRGGKRNAEEPYPLHNKSSKSDQEDRSDIDAITEQLNFKELKDEKLLKMSINEIESYIQEVSAHKNLGASEKKNLKRIQRKIKNRGYAQLSRDKKKLFVEDLQKQVADTKSEKSSLSERIASLEHENKTLKNFVATVVSAIERDRSILESIQKVFPDFSLQHLNDSTSSTA